MRRYTKAMLKARVKREEQKAIAQQVERLRSRCGLSRNRLGPMQVLDKAEVQSLLDKVGREGAESKVQDLLRAEVDEHLGRMKYEHKPGNRQRGYRNGYAPARTLATNCGPITVKLHKLRGLARPFKSRLIPRRQRQTASVSNLLPELYLAGLSLGDFEIFLRVFLGDGATLSASTVARLKAKWEDEYRIWLKRPLASAYAYVWADGIYLRVGLSNERLAVLVVLGVTADGQKEFLAIEPGYRESEDNWRSVLLSVRERGAKQIRLVIGDGCKGLWNAVDTCYWEAKQQLCWQHKIRNILGQLPRALHARARADLKAIYLSPTRALATEGCIRFAAKYQAYGPAVESLLKNQVRLLTFYDFPQAHWVSIRTTNPIESTFSPVRTRLNKAKRIMTTYAALALVHQLLLKRQGRMRRLVYGHLAADVIGGAKYRDGIALDRRTRLGRSA